MEKIKIILAFCASIVIMIIVGVFLFTSTGKYRNNYDWVTHTQNNISEAQSILSYLQDIETSTRGYAITGKEIYLKPYYKALASIDRTLLTLKNQIKDNATQKHLLETISRLVELKKTFSKKIIDSWDRGNFEEARRVVSTGIGEGAMSESRTRIAEFIGNEKLLTKQRRERQKMSVWSEQP